MDGKFYPVTFGHQQSVTIPAGEPAISDGIHCYVKAQSTFDVSFYLKDYTQMRSVVFTSGPLSYGSYALGDLTEVAHFPMDQARTTHYFYFLSNVSVYTSEKIRTVVCYGDSISAQDWPDYLTLRCQKEGYDNTAIIRRATSGSRILREYSCITY